MFLSYPYTVFVYRATLGYLDLLFKTICLSVRRQLVNVPSFIVRLDSEKHIGKKKFLQENYLTDRPFL